MSATAAPATKPNNQPATTDAPQHQTVTVASVQVSSNLGDVAGNIAKITPLVVRAATERNAKFIVLPETAITGYLSQDLMTNWHIGGGKRKNAFANGKDPKGSAEPQNGPSVQHFANLAKALGVYITVPFLEEEHYDGTTPSAAESEGASGESILRQVRYFNAISLVGPDGSVRGHYRKTSPWPHPEQSWATAGDDVTPIDTEYGRVGLAICFDIHSVLAKYEPHKIWALLYPIAWVGNPLDWYRLELPQMLRNVNCPHHIIGCNWSTDEKQPWEGAGISTHFGPRGEICGSTSEAQGSTIVYSTIPTAASAPDVGRLDVARYAKWTAAQGVPKSWKMAQKE